MEKDQTEDCPQTALEMLLLFLLLKEQATKVKYMSSKKVPVLV